MAFLTCCYAANVALALLMLVLVFYVPGWLTPVTRFLVFVELAALALHTSLLAFIVLFC